MLIRVIDGLLLMNICMVTSTAPAARRLLPSKTHQRSMRYEVALACDIAEKSRSVINSLTSADGSPFVSRAVE